MAVQVTVRMIRKNDLDAVVAIDKLITGQERREYYQRKLAMALDDAHNVNASLAAEIDGKVVGFMMGDVLFGEYGIADSSATCLLYTSPRPRDRTRSRIPSSA